MIVLGIESTCDETAASIVKDGTKILSNVLASQIDLHKKYGGVFPELAARRHSDTMLPIIEQAMKEACIDTVDLIAVAKGPGLMGALLIGLHVAKTLAIAWEKPFIGINHVEAHLYAAMMDNPKKFPALGVVLSGGHTFIIEIRSVGDYRMIGTTVDDAIGEAFDKVARLLGLPYPGGPEIELLAKKGDETKYPFKSGKVKNQPFAFSFSGLKTNVLYLVKGHSQDKKAPSIIPDEERKHIAASFQKTALQDVISKAFLASKQFPARAIYIGGGVSNNQKLREMFNEQNFSIPIYWPSKGLSLDNAAMIAGLGYHKYLQQKISDPLNLEPMTRIPL